ncbi:UNVERIFIED_ORG: glycosyltransferase involved in cell wall biosynthesis [Heyndrickxia coagulans]
MLKKRICIIAQFPPPVHGLSKAVETLYNSRLANRFILDKIDISDNKKIIKNLFKIWLSKADLFYFTLSQTKGGNVRDLIILQLIRFKKKKCIVHLHGGYYRKLVDNQMNIYQKKWNYYAIKSLSGVIVLGPSLIGNFRGMISDDKIFTVPNCVDNKYLITNEEFENKISTLEGKDVFQVLYLSNFIKSKGYTEVLEMAVIEKKRVTSGGKRAFHFNFAGKFFNRSDKEFFFNYIKNNQLEDFVTYHGVVDGSKKRNLLKLCDCFILLTRYPNEGQPIAILEAMGNGMVVVTTNHAGIPDIVRNGVNGIVVSKNQINVREIYYKIYNSRNQFYKTIKKNRKDCVLLYNENIYLEKLEGIFKKI